MCRLQAGKSARWCRGKALLFLCALLAGCADPAYQSRVPSGCVAVSGRGGATFAIPTGYDAVPLVKDAKDLKDPSGKYHLRTDTEEAYVSKEGIYAEVFWKAESVDLIRDIEKKGKVRIEETRTVKNSYHTYRKMRKTIYACKAQALFNHVYYADYQGYLAVIQKDDQTVAFLAAHPGDFQVEDLTIAKTLHYFAYEPKVNAGKQTNEKASKKERGDLGETVRAAVLYKGKEATVVPFSLTLDRIKETTPSVKDFEGTPIKQAPPLPDGYGYGIAEFSVDPCGYDTIQENPFVRIRMGTKDGKERAEYAATYMLTSSKNKIRVLFLRKKGETVVFLVGRNGALIDAGKGEGT